MSRVKKSTKSPDRAALFLISRAQRPIILEVEVASHMIKKFVKNYCEWTGTKSTWSKLSGKGFAIDCGSGKWGAECRIYFTKDETIKRQLKRYGYKIENGDIRYDGTFRINSKELFQQLVEHDGFNLGNNM